MTTIIIAILSAIIGYRIKRAIDKKTISKIKTVMEVLRMNLRSEKSRNEKELESIQIELANAKRIIKQYNR